MKRFPPSSRRRTRLAAGAVAVVVAGALGLSACSSSGGKKAAQQQSQAAGVNAAAGPRLRIAMITHAGPGDTFWDIVQKGAKVAAAKDNVQFLYSADQEGGKQAQLVQAAIDQKVDGIIVTLAKPDALKDVIARAVQAKIPVVSINSGAEVATAFGALVHFGQDETVAGRAAGEQLGKIGAKKAICVIHEQGNVGLEARCAGAKKTFPGQIENHNVPGTNMPQVKSSITAKLQSDKGIDGILALNADIALTAADAAKDAGSSAKIATFDMNKQLIAALEDGRIQFAIDQQPYLQGYEAVDELWLYKRNGNILGGGQPVFTGPAIVDKTTASSIKQFADQGTR